MACHHHSQNSQSYPELNYSPGAKWVKNLTRDRLNNFEGGHFSGVNLSSALFTHRLDGPEFVHLQVWSAPGLSKPSFEEAMTQKFRPAKKTNHWWKVSVTIPEYWQQYERIQFEFDPGCEAMIFTVDGVPLQGITGGYGGERRVEYIIPREYCLEGVHEFVIESSCNGMFGVPWNGDTIQPPDMNRYFALASADLVVPNQEAWHLLWDFTTLKELSDALPGNTPLQNKALTAANEIMNVFKKGDPKSIAAARRIAEDVFGEGWEEKGAAIYDEGTQRANVWGIGDCHIDSAWLWPYRVTQQKVARSWSTQVDLMERYPEHRFACSSAQQYKWLEKLYPPLFERVREQILAGKFHPIGGAWVEHDGNMPSGEALVRQMLYGQRYFESRFGVRCETGWLPDSFGLTGAMPQIMRGCGMKYFFTQKLSWNNINRFPHSTFNWVGIDGTQVLCHMTPVDTYGAQATAGEINKGLTNHKNLESSDTALLVFGNGDGGGGPLPKMLESLRRLRAVANTHRELPSVNMGKSVDEFFYDLAATTDKGSLLPNWHGELYLEFHRGTYTSHGSIKKGNRHGEILLRDLEHVATLASLVRLYSSRNGKAEYVYPKAKIDEAWEKVLLNQFHDVLPGSAIGMVYEDAEKLYAEVQHDCRILLEDAFDVLFPDSFPLTKDTSQRLLARAKHVLAYNTTFFPRCDIIEVPLISASSILKGQVMQTSSDGKTGYALVRCEGGAPSTPCTPAASGLDLHKILMPATVYSNGSDHFVLSNANVQLTIADGRITSLLDVKQGRELIANGATGGLVIFEDRPNYWDAWDVEIHHLETAQQLKFTSISVVSHGPLRAAIAAELKYCNSLIKVIISLDAVAATAKENSRSLFRFDATVDWHERHKFLKFELPLNIHSPSATYECQFGHVQRPTHKNTTLDIAKFEVCGHKYADLSEFGYGVALLSESKYGFSCQGSILCMSLLRAATAPDAEQDQGEHNFSWAVLPHEGFFLESDVPVAAYLFNSPLRVRCTREKSIENALIRVGEPKPPFIIEGASNVILETIKRGEDDKFSLDVDPTSDAESTGSNESNETSTTFATARAATPGNSDLGPNMTVILRLYEAFGGHAQATLKITGSLAPYVSAAYVTNMLEEEQVELKLLRAGDEGAVMKGIGGEDALSALTTLNFRGFEVKTVKLIVQGSKIDHGVLGMSSSSKKGKRDSWVDLEQEQGGIFVRKST
ncbi:glycoside hydrolase family 38 protein [Amanita muscaria Koide BX008]|uniref:Alpha-mannosidase n=1 Tax=Amanita muscaria (strain Koide BX008) TaxID=946122 RepID=A0A0C2WWK8_AMAMK|nr:glycoside hydrolase family 38 protein [Amanita muscaria Koide BX008]